MHKVKVFHNFSNKYFLCVHHRTHTHYVYKFQLGKLKYIFVIWTHKCTKVLFMYITNSTSSIIQLWVILKDILWDEKTVQKVRFINLHYTMLVGCCKTSLIYQKRKEKKFWVFYSLEMSIRLWKIFVYTIVSTFVGKVICLKYPVIYSEQIWSSIVSIALNEHDFHYKRKYKKKTFPTQNLFFTPFCLLYTQPSIPLTKVVAFYPIDFYLNLT